MQEGDSKLRAHTTSPAIPPIRDLRPALEVVRAPHGHQRLRDHLHPQAVPTSRAEPSRADLQPSQRAELRRAAAEPQPCRWSRADTAVPESRADQTQPDDLGSTIRETTNPTTPHICERPCLGRPVERRLREGDKEIQKICTALSVQCNEARAVPQSDYGMKVSVQQ